MIPFKAAYRYSVDRSADADRAIQFLLAPGRRVAVLYGRRGSRRRELIREWIIPGLKGRREAYYADCDPDFPFVVAALEHTLPLEDALRAGAIVLLGRMDQYLSGPEQDQRRLTELLSTMERGELPGMLVLVVAERSLADLIGFQGAAPTLMANILEVPVVTFRESLQRLSSAADDSKLRYDPPSVEALAAEAERMGAGDGVELAWAVDQGFRRFKAGVGAPVTLGDCQEIGGLAGALEEYCEGQLDKAAERWRKEGRRAVEIILSEVVCAANAGTEPDLNDIGLRLGIADALFRELLDWVRGEGQMLRQEGDRQWDVVPAELRPIVEQKAARKHRDVVRAQALLREGVRSWSELGVVLPPKRLDEIEAVRELLPATTEEAALMVRSLLRVDGPEDPSSVRYWLRRIRSEPVEISTVAEALFADAPAVRARAARFLDSFDQPEVRRHLYRFAIEDPDDDVRLAALATLGRMRVDDLWPSVSQEVRDHESPYQLHAVAALRLFPDERTSRVLSELVAYPGQRPEVRRQAISTLAEVGTPGGVKSLVDIGLNDVDAEDRANAAAALSHIQSRERVREAVDAVRDSEVNLEQADRFTVRHLASVVLRSVLSVTVGCINIYLHGMALIALRRYIAGLAFLGCELLLWLLSRTPGWGELAYFLMVLNWLACQLVATRVAMLDEKRNLEEWESSTLRRKPPRWQLGTPFTITLFLIDLVPFAVVHGLAHALAGRLRRAIRLFGLELFGIVWLVAGLFFFGGGFGLITPFSQPTSDLLLYVYAGIGTLLVVGTFFWDVIPTANALLTGAHRRRGRRRALLYENIATNAAAAEYLLECAAQRSDRQSRWAQRLVERTATAMPLDPLLRSLKDQRKRPGYLLRALKSTKHSNLVQALGQEWQAAGPRLRRWMVDILAGKPNEASLQQLRATRQELDWYGRLRYALALWDYRFRLWPRSLIFASLLFVPLAVLASYEVVETIFDPSRPVLRMVQTPQVRRRMRDDQLLETLQFLAKVHTADSPDVLRGVFRESMAEQRDVWKKYDRVGETLCSLPVYITDASQQEKVAALREELAVVLCRGLKSGDPDASKGLRLIELNPDTDRCNLSEKSRKDLAQAASELLTSATTAESADLAIAGLGASGHRQAVDPLRRFALKLTEGKTERNAEQWDKLRRDALAALSRNPSPEAADALIQIAGSKDAPKVSAQEAERLAEQRYEGKLAELKAPLERGEYKEAHDAALKLLNTSPPKRLREGLVDVLAQASYHLAESDPESNRWSSEAIEYLEQTRRTHYWNSDSSPRMLSKAYAFRAYYKKNERDPAAAFNDATHAIKEDPKSSLAYCVRGWLLLQQRDYQAGSADVLTAVQKDPTYAWSYYLLQLVYEKQAEQNPDRKQQLLNQAARQFEGLAKQYPNVMWPRRRLCNIYHDLIATPVALQRTYDLYTEMERQFAGQFTESYSLDFNSNFLEARLTVGRYQEVVDKGSELDQQLPENDYDLRIPVKVLRYAALVMQGDASAAETQLSALERLVSQLPNNYSLDWSYSGTVAYLQHQALKSDAQVKMIELVEAADKLNRTRSLDPAVVAANHGALHLMMARANR